MSQDVVDWDSVAGSADTGLAADLGELNRRFQEGRVGRYLLLYCWSNEENVSITTTSYDRSDAVWAIGAAEHLKYCVQHEWTPVETEH